MCGRATVVNPDGITEKVYGFTKKLVPSDWKPRYNLNPREEIPAVYYDPFLKERVLRTMHWNFIPSKLASKDKVGEFDSHYSAFNARIETVASAPTFEQAWRSQRCLVVVDGIIEWVGEKRHKIPHLIRHREGKPLAMAGLWSRWRDGRDGDEIWSCTIIVKDADDWYRRFHDRMAVLLAPEACEEWLEVGRREVGGGRRWLSEAAYRENGELEYFPISKLVNNVRNDSPEVLEPTVYPDPEPDIELLLDL